jgi:hypothetical protein
LHRICLEKPPIKRTASLKSEEKFKRGKCPARKCPGHFEHKMQKDYNINTDLQICKKGGHILYVQE